MNLLRSGLGRYLTLRQSGNLLNGISWHQNLSISAVLQDSHVKEEPAFGLLSLDPSSKYYEKRGLKESSIKSEEYNKEVRASSRLQKGVENDHRFTQRNTAEDPYSSSKNYEQDDSKVASSHIQRERKLMKWRELKSQKFSQSLIQDDDEDEYLRYISSEPEPKLKVFSSDEPKTKLKTFNERFKQRKLQARSEQNLNASPDVPISNEEQMFGQLAPTKDLYEIVKGDEGDEKQQKYEEALLQQRHSPVYYGNRMKKLCKERKLAEALKIIEVEMPAAAVKPDYYCYQVLINACGRVGYTKKAFHLYNQMKKRGLKVQDVAYTGLFNACANSPWLTNDGLKRAHKLRKQLMDSGFVFNQIISHTMIKAFGMCGDIKTSFLIVDEMLEQGLLVNTETINFMLHACNSDQETGFRHSLLVWRKMRELRLKPDIYSYNLLIRCIGSCKAGDPSLTIQLLEGTTGSKNIDKPKTIRKRSDGRVDLLNATKVPEKSNKVEEVENLDKRSGVSENQVEVLDRNYSIDTVKKTSTEMVLPNLLGKKISKGDAIAISSLEQSEDRLALVGGPAGILGQMMKDKVTPDLKTVTQMLDSLPSNTEVENSLLQSMKNIGLSPDTQFCNMLIRKRFFRCDDESAKTVLDLMQEFALLPDLITFGCLALGCRNLHSAYEFLRDMDAAGFSPNEEIMSTLVRIGISRDQYFYSLEMLREMRKREIVPSESLVLFLEEAREKTRKSQMALESGKLEATEGNKKKVESMKRFLLEYKTWLKKSDVQLNDHPWAQYKLSSANS